MIPVSEIERVVVDQLKESGTCVLGRICNGVCFDEDEMDYPEGDYHFYIYKITSSKVQIKRILMFFQESVMETYVNILPSVEFISVRDLVEKDSIIPDIVTFETVLFNRGLSKEVITNKLNRFANSKRADYPIFHTCNEEIITGREKLDYTKEDDFVIDWINQV